MLKYYNASFDNVQMKLNQWKWKLEVVIHKNDKYKENRNLCELTKISESIPGMMFENPMTKK